MDASTLPNHHHDHPGFAGISGLVAALTFSVGRGAAARLAAELTGVGDDDTVVDVGCGPGVAARHAASRGATVIGVDPAPVMLRVGRLLTRGPRVRYVEGTADSLPLADGTATAAWSLSTVHHWANIDRGVGEAHRVLRAGGRFVTIERLTTPGATGIASHGWTRPQAEAFGERLAAGGFTDVVVEERRAPRAVLVARAWRP